MCNWPGQSSFGFVGILRASDLRRARLREACREFPESGAETVADHPAVSTRNSSRGHCSLLPRHLWDAPRPWRQSRIAAGIILGEFHQMAIEHGELGVRSFTEQLVKTAT